MFINSSVRDIIPSLKTIATLNHLWISVESSREEQCLIQGLPRIDISNLK